MRCSASHIDMSLEQILKIQILKIQILKTEILKRQFDTKLTI